MRLSIIIIGDEILLGRVTDTNSGLIASRFSSIGWQVGAVRTVGDNAAAIEQAIADSLASSDLVVTTGGLGPTRDDITKNVLMRVFGGELRMDDSVTTNIERIFKERGRELNDLTRSQALVPTSCRVIQNICGTAPVMWFEKDGKVLIAMPGVPFETRSMLPEVSTQVEEHFGSAGRILHREFTVTGISESALAEQLANFEDSMPQGYKLAYLPSPGEILLRLDGKPDDSTANFDRCADALVKAIGDHLAGIGMMEPAQMLLHRLREKGYTLASAESCTGGNIAHLITSQSGCSDVYVGGVVSYCNEVKMNILGVSIDTLSTVGAVSRDTVRQMAAGACRVCHAECAMATSGIAGPGGAVPGKPVGTVWIAARTPDSAVEKLCHFSGDRQTVVERASAEAIMLLQSLL